MLGNQNGNCMIKEACVGNINEALKAEKQGANRIELCENLLVGGTTPSAGTIAIAKKMLKIPIMVLIRPRGGNFIYSSDEIEVMKHDIELCKGIGVQGVVIGALNADSSINIPLLNAFVKLAKPMEITFHKAIDETKNIQTEFSKLLNSGVDRLLTSGTKETALEGKNIINELVSISNGKIKIIAAGKITNTNLPQIQSQIHADEFHGKKIVGNLSD